jgi:Fibronectin type III domain
MRLYSILLAAGLGLLLVACGGSDPAAPGAPTDVAVAAGATAGTAVVSFSAPVSTGSSAITGYTVTASPGGITASGPSSPITLTGLAARTAYTYSVVANNAAGSSAAAATGLLRLYAVEETFLEPMTQPNDTIFTGTFTYDTTSKSVSNLTGVLTQAMTKVDGVYGPPMTTVALVAQLSSAAVTLGGVEGLLVTTFALPTTNTFDPSGFAPGGTEYYGLSAGALNPKAGGVGNAYAMIFVNTADPTTTLEQAQIDKLAYADCTAGGMMMNTCMTGTTTAGYGRMGTMMGRPVSQVVTER